MNEESFVKKREPDWQRFKALAERADVSLSNLSDDEASELVLLYRRVSGDLAQVRTTSSNPGLTEFLNRLVGLGYSVLYRRRPIPIGTAIRVAVETIASTGRRNKAFIFTATGLFFFGAIFAYVLMSRVPGAYEYVVPEGWNEVVQQWKSGGFEERTSSQSFMMTGFYASNNPMASISAAALSVVSFGLMTVKLMFDNGLLLGALGYEMASVGKFGFLIMSVTPHGVTELSGIFVAGGAGLRLGWAVVAPGRNTRGESLRIAGKDALVLLGAALIMMFIAAPIEGFFSFNPVVPEVAKVLFACGSVVAWTAFWKLVGRERDEQTG